MDPLMPSIDRFGRGPKILTAVVGLLIFSWWLTAPKSFVTTVRIRDVQVEETDTLRVPESLALPCHVQVLIKGHLDGNAQLSLTCVDEYQHSLFQDLGPGDVYAVLEGERPEPACVLKYTPLAKSGKLTVRFKFWPK
jgi:hypothetical protein